MAMTAGGVSEDEHTTKENAAEKETEAKTTKSDSKPESGEEKGTTKSAETYEVKIEELKIAWKAIQKMC